MHIAVGDQLFKLPAVYTTRVFLNAAAQFKIHTPLGEIVPRIRTPPYLSNAPGVRHVALRSAFPPEEPAGAQDTAREQARARFLILASDGLVDLTDGDGDVADAGWGQAVGAALLRMRGGPPSTASGVLSREHSMAEGDLPSPPLQGASTSTRHPEPANPALALLRAALGGGDGALVSRMLTVEMGERWMDDTTVVVLRL